MKQGIKIAPKMMRHTVFYIGLGLTLIGSSLGQKSGIDFIRPKDRKILSDQASHMYESLRPVALQASKSTVELFYRNDWVGVGTVIAPEKVVTKFSEIQRVVDQLACQSYQGERYTGVIPYGVYPEHDLVILRVPGLQAPAIEWSEQTSPALGSFLVAPLSSGQLAAMGVVSARPRSLLGVYTEPNTQGLGLIIKELQEGEAAHRAGLRVGDQILKVGDENIDSHSHLVGALLQLEVGEEVIVQILREGKRQDIRVQLEERRPKAKRVSSRRERVMRQMGTRVSAVSEGFPSAMQSDMQIDTRLAGGSVVDLNGEAVGIIIARASRVKTVIIPARTLREVFKEEPQRFQYQQRERYQDVAPGLEGVDLFKLLRKLMNE